MIYISKENRRDIPGGFLRYRICNLLQRKNLREDAHRCGTRQDTEGSAAKLLLEEPEEPAGRAR